MVWILLLWVIFVVPSCTWVNNRSVWDLASVWHCLSDLWSHLVIELGYTTCFDCSISSLFDIHLFTSSVQEFGVGSSWYHFTSSLIVLTLVSEQELLSMFSHIDWIQIRCPFLLLFSCFSMNSEVREVIYQLKNIVNPPVMSPLWSSLRHQSKQLR